VAVEVGDLGDELLMAAGEAAQCELADRGRRRRCSWTPGDSERDELVDREAS
jgi:hypothetical protein